eukprot:6206133-Pleurochrysis_carterae.AAC.1
MAVGEAGRERALRMPCRQNDALDLAEPVISRDAKEHRHAVEAPKLQRAHGEQRLDGAHGRPPVHRRLIAIRRSLTKALLDDRFSRDLPHLSELSCPDGAAKLFAERHAPLLRALVLPHRTALAQTAHVAQVDARLNESAME